MNKLVLFEDKLCLFDIDGTLVTVKADQELHQTFSDAFKKVYGVSAEVDWRRIQGKTDQQIIMETMLENGLTEKEIKPKINECMDEMVNAFKRRLSEGGVISSNEGVIELLEEFEKRGVLMGLVTGNLEQIARTKLKSIGLNGYFKVGGFGSDHISRTELVKLAIKRAGDKFGFKRNNNVFLFGDAPQDMRAGKEAGVTTTGVTTGVYSNEQLKEAGADLILENLKDTKRVLKLIYG